MDILDHGLFFSKKKKLELIDRQYFGCPREVHIKSPDRLGRMFAFAIL